MLPPLCINLDILVQRGGKMFLLNTLRMNANPFSAPSVAGNAFSWIAFYMRTWQKCGEEERKWRQIWWPNVYVNCCGRYFCQLMHTFHTCLLLCLTRWNKEFSHWCGASKKKRSPFQLLPPLQYLLQNYWYPWNFFNILSRCSYKLWLDHSKICTCFDITHFNRFPWMPDFWTTWTTVTHLCRSSRMITGPLAASLNNCLPILTCQFRWTIMSC